MSGPSHSRAKPARPPSARLGQQLCAHSYPSITLQPEVEQSADLVGSLENGALDFIIVPNAFQRPRLKSIPLASVENAWMCSPAFMPARHIIPLKQLAEFPVLVQGARSGSRLLYDRWLQDNEVEFKRYIRSNSLVALVGLTISSVGISHLPKDCFRILVERDELRMIRTNPVLPPVTYVILFREDAPQDLVGTISHQARTACDFTMPIRWS